MKTKKHIRISLTFCLIGFIILMDFPAAAANYYVDDNSNVGDVYTPAVTGSGAGNGSIGAPVNSVTALMGMVSLIPGDIVYIDAGTYTEVVTITVSGTAANPISFIGAGNTLTYIKAPTALASTTPNGVVALDGSKYVIISQLNISVYDDSGTTADDNTNTATTGIAIKNDADYSVVNNCITGNVGYAIDVLGYAMTPDNIEIKYCSLTSFYVGIRLKYGPTNANIHDNTVEIIPRTGFAFAALEGQYAYTFNVHHNKFIARPHPSSPAGFRYDEGCTHFGHTSSGTLSNNYIWINVPPTDELDANPAVAIDDQSAITFIHNSIYSLSDGLRYNCAQCDASPVTFGLNCTFINNIVYSSTGDCVDLRCISSDGTMAGVSVLPKFTICDGNLYYAPSGNVSRHVPFVTDAGSAANFRPANSVVRNLAQWKTYDPDVSGGANTAEVDGLYGDPQYINIPTVVLDIPAGSPAEDAVVRASAMTDDIIHTARPQGTAKEIGAFEIVTTMPVDFIEGKSKCNEGSILLEWITANEKNNAYFSIEYSADGINYIEAGRVYPDLAAGLTHHYTYASTSGNGYYKIRQHDIDGISAVVFTTYAACQNTSEINWWITDGNLNLSGSGLPQQGFVNISVYNVLGIEIMKLKADTDDFTSIININSLPEAVYIGVIQTDLQLYTIKFVKP